MKTLRLEVFQQTATHHQLRFFEGNAPTPFHTRLIDPQELAQFIRDCEQQYAKGLSLHVLGDSLFAWLNGQESILANYQNDTVLQLPASSQLSRLAWELLHNDKAYFCANLHKPFTPLRLVSSDQQAVEVANRPLRLLFMASSPENVKPVLNFEHEEALILEATRKSNLELVVEESGSLEGLAERLSYGDESERFDVVHITGHADIDKKQPVFVLEDEFGDMQLAKADEIASVFSRYGRFPRLLFLSGCKTAQAPEETLSSLCEALVLAGLPAVLGWAKPVYDSVASFTAQKLYEYLADGLELGRAVALTRQALYAEEMKTLQKTPHYKPQWHLLRFYSDNTPLKALVIKGRRKPQRNVRQEFLDGNAKLEVCPREAFVGRRRLLQRALRILRSQQQVDEYYADALLLLGMGGLGKSSLAVRLCQRLEQHLRQCFIVIGSLDEITLRGEFSKKLPAHAPEINSILNQENELSLRLTHLFNQFDEFHQALFVFDDFEQNFPDNNPQQLKPEAYKVLHALLTAIHNTGSPSRVLLTSRYEVVMPAPLKLATLALNSFSGTDLDKKTSALHSQYLETAKISVSTELEKKVVTLGAGNPRLLEYLYDILARYAFNPNELFQKLENKEAEFRTDLLLKTLLDYQTAETRRLIAAVALFEIPIPEAVLEQALNTKPLEKALRTAIALGLVEIYQARYFVSRLLVPLVADELSDEEQKAIYSQVAEALYQLWWVGDYRKQMSFEEASELGRVAELSEQKVIFSEVRDILAATLYGSYRYDEARVLYCELLPLFQEVSDKKGEARTLNTMGGISLSQGDYETALDYFQQSLAIYQGVSDKGGEGMTLNNISQIFRARGKHETALDYLQDSLKIFREIGDKSGECTTINNMATIISDQGDNEKSLRYLQQSLKTSQEIEDRELEGKTLNNISQIYHDQKDYETALDYLQKSLMIKREIGDKRGEGTTLNNISQIYSERGDYETALDCAQQSLIIQHEIGNISGLCATLVNMGHLSWVKKDRKESMDYYISAYRLAKQMGHAKTLVTLDRMARQLGGEGLAYWEQLSSES
jgi:tetratricopeptide (TPR) repeat protein